MNRSVVIVAIALIALVVCAAAVNSNDENKPRRRRVGALSDVKPATPKVQSYVDAVFADVRAKVPELAEAQKPEAVLYARQVVAGINYFVKVKVTLPNGLESYAHIRIFKPLKGEVQLAATEADHSADDEIVYFQ